MRPGTKLVTWGGRMPPREPCPPSRTWSWLRISQKLAQNQSKNEPKNDPKMINFLIKKWSKNDPFFGHFLSSAIHRALKIDPFLAPFGLGGLLEPQNSLPEGADQDLLTGLCQAPGSSQGQHLTWKSAKFSFLKIWPISKIAKSTIFEIV